MLERAPGRHEQHSIAGQWGRATEYKPSARAEQVGVTFVSNILKALINREQSAGCQRGGGGEVPSTLYVPNDQNYVTNQVYLPRNKSETQLETRAVLLGGQ